MVNKNVREMTLLELCDEISTWSTPHERATQIILEVRCRKAKRQYDPVLVDEERVDVDILTDAMEGRR